MVQVEKKTGEEKQFQMRPTTAWIVELVNETLQRLTPARTKCVLSQNFDVTDIPEFYFADNPDSDEDAIEMARIHTVLDPPCFRQFSGGLASYVRSLPSTDLDSECDFES